MRCLNYYIIVVVIIIIIIIIIIILYSAYGVQKIQTILTDKKN